MSLGIEIAETNIAKGIGSKDPIYCYSSRHIATGLLRLDIFSTLAAAFAWLTTNMVSFHCNLRTKSTLSLYYINYTPVHHLLAVT